MERVGQRFLRAPRLARIHAGTHCEANARLSKLILDRQPWLARTVSALRGAGSLDGSTSSWRRTNLLTWKEPEVEPLLAVIQAGIRAYADAYALSALPDWVNCWPNVLRFGEGLREHSHGGLEHIAGVYYVSCDPRVRGGETVFSMAGTSGSTKTLKVSPVEGLLCLFQSDLHHFVARHRGAEPRITIAFDLVFKPRKRDHRFIRLADTFRRARAP